VLTCVNASAGEVKKRLETGLLQHFTKEADMCLNCVQWAGPEVRRETNGIDDVTQRLREQAAVIAVRRIYLMTACDQVVHQVAADKALGPHHCELHWRSPILRNGMPA